MNKFTSFKKKEERRRVNIHLDVFRSKKKKNVMVSHFLDGLVFPSDCFRLFFKTRTKNGKNLSERETVKLETTGAKTKEEKERKMKIAFVCFVSPTRDHRLSRKKNETNYYSSREQRRKRKRKTRPKTKKRRRRGSATRKEKKQSKKDLYLVFQWVLITITERKKEMKTPRLNRYTPV